MAVFYAYNPYLGIFCDLRTQQITCIQLGSLINIWSDMFKEVYLLPYKCRLNYMSIVTACMVKAGANIYSAG